MTATYIPSKLENGVKLGIYGSCSLFWVIKPFTEDLFRTTFYHRNSINSNYAIVFKIEIKNEEEFVQAGEFYYRSDGNPFEPEMKGLKTNRDLFHYLDQPFKILVTTSFFYFSDPYPLEYNVEPGEELSINDSRTFKLEQCVICLEKEPKVLFCNCGHICICGVCSVKKLNTCRCPVCKKENTILRIIE